MKKCFVISPIGNADSEIRRRSDTILKYIIKPVLETLDYETCRADEIDRPGLITSQIIQRILEYDLVIADLTDSNPNVFYELGIRHSIKKPLVQIMQQGERIPFDVAGLRTIIFNLQDLESVEQAKTEIRNQIIEINKPDYHVETPVSITSSYLSLASSHDPNQKIMGEMMSIIAEMRNELIKNDGNKNCPVVGESIENIVSQVSNSVSKNLANIQYKQFRKKMDPFFFKEVLHFSKSRKIGPSILLMVFSRYKETMPWVYELGLEMHHALRAKKYNVAKQIAIEIKETTMAFMKSGLAEEYVFERKELFMMVEELPYFIDKYLMEIIETSKNEAT